VGDGLIWTANLKEPAMKDGNKLVMVSNVADAMLFTIEAKSFYSLGGITSAIIFGPAIFAFLVIASGLLGAT